MESPELLAKALAPMDVRPSVPLTAVIPEPLRASPPTAVAEAGSSIGPPVPVYETTVVPSSVNSKSPSVILASTVPRPLKSQTDTAITAATTHIPMILVLPGIGCFLSSKNTFTKKNHYI